MSKLFIIIVKKRFVKLTPQAKLETFDFSSKDDLLILKKILIKACDISNEIRPIGLAEPWVDCLLTEYFSQVSQ